MGISTAQATGFAHVQIDAARCDGCGLCVDVCRGAPLHLREHRVEVDQSRLFGCIACGHCMAVCPRNAIQIHGRGLSPKDLGHLPARVAAVPYADLLSLMEHRRSCRTFSYLDVSPAHIHQILAAAETAPVSLPPSGVGVLVREGREPVQQLRRDLLDVIRRRRWLFAPPMVWLWRPFMTAAQWRLMRSFVKPAFDAYLGEQPNLPDDDWFFYHAPLAIYFYPSETSDPADASIAATHALLAAESLGYSTCFLGFPGQLFAMDRSIRARYDIPHHARPGLTLLVGHSRIRPLRSIRRHFARLDWRDQRHPAAPPA